MSLASHPQGVLLSRIPSLQHPEMKTSIFPLPGDIAGYVTAPGVAVQVLVQRRNKKIRES